MQPTQPVVIHRDFQTTNLMLFAGGNDFAPGMVLDKCYLDGTAGSGLESVIAPTRS